MICGAVVGDFLDKPTDKGGLALSRFVASGVLFALIAACIFLVPQRAAKRAPWDSDAGIAKR